jgi:hypothetical protein
VGQSVSLDALEKEIESGFIGLTACNVVGVVTELCCRVMRDFCKVCLQNILHLTVAEYCSSAFPKLFSSGDHFYQSECSTDHSTLVPFESKLFKILNYSV